MIGIDAPESRRNEKSGLDAAKIGLNQEAILVMGKRSKDFLKGFLKPEMAIRLGSDIRKRDKYGQLLCYAFLPD